MFSRCLTTRVTSYDQPSLQMMQMLYCFVNNIHVDFTELLWKGFHYSLTNPTTMIPYPIFAKFIMSHYMTTFPDISKRSCDRYYILADDVMIKSIFNSGKSKGVVGMKIPDWMITEDMKLTKTYRLYVEVFGVDENQVLHEDDLVLQDTLQVSLAKQKSHEELEAKQNVEKVKEHLMAEEIKKLVEGSENVEENVEVANSPLRNDDNQTNPGTRLEPRSDKESLEVEKIANISQHVNVIEEEEESVKDKTHFTLISSDTEKLQELTETDIIPSSSTPSSSSSKLSATNRILSLLKPNHGRFKRYKSIFDEQQGKYSYMFGHLTT
ncbi:hypothetical protein Tco_1088052, partial [Tanacetum coccineum]